ncbi:MAG: TonB-dependent receptor [Bacteroidales bacterium]|nr:TonB-dependent receptor [Bacteroidales bacterium]
MKLKFIATLLFVGIFFTAFSQNDTIIKLSEVKITSSANPVLLDRSGRFIQVLNQKEINRFPLNNVEGVLNQFSGFDVRSRGPFGVQSDLSIRGGSFDQNVILLNGIPINDPQTGHNTLDFSLAPDNIKKIEVIQGPASRWFGPNAFSGGINIITEPDSVNNISFHLTGGQYGLFSGLVSGNYILGKIRNLTSVRYSKSDGYQKDTDFKATGLFHQSVYQNRLTRVQLQVSYQDKAYGANGFYTAQYPDQFEHTRNLFSSLSIGSGRKVKWNGAVSWRRMYDRFELFRQGTNWYEKEGNWYVMGQDSAGYRTPYGFFPYTGPNFHRTDVLFGKGQMHFSSLFGKTAMSVSFKRDYIISNVLGTLMADTLHSLCDPQAYYTNSAQRNELNLNANQLYSKENFTVSAGFNLFYSNMFGVFFSPGLNLSYGLSVSYQLFASVNRAIRLPTFTDLYYEGPDHVSNPDLKPEQITGIETGIKYFSRTFFVTASIFDRIGVHMIDWVKTSPDEKWSSENLTRLNTYGIAFAGVYQSVSKNSFVQSLGLNYTFLQSDKNASGYISLYALDYLKHDVSLFMMNRLLHRLTSSVTFKLEKRNGSYLDYETSQLKPYETVFLLDTKLMYQLDKFEIYLQANNLLNQRYHDTGSVLLPGIWVMGGVRFHINL